MSRVELLPLVCADVVVYFFCFQKDIAYVIAGICLFNLFIYLFLCFLAGLPKKLRYIWLKF